MDEDLFSRSLNLVFYVAVPALFIKSYSLDRACHSSTLRYLSVSHSLRGGSRGIYWLLDAASIGKFSVNRAMSKTSCRYCIEL